MRTQFADNHKRSFLAKAAATTRPIPKLWTYLRLGNLPSSSENLEGPKKLRYDARRAPSPRGRNGRNRDAKKLISACAKAL
jgi:hypothetical protein